MRSLDRNSLDTGYYIKESEKVKVSKGISGTDALSLKNIKLENLDPKICATLSVKPLLKQTFDRCVKVSLYAGWTTNSIYKFYLQVFENIFIAL